MEKFEKALRLVHSDYLQVIHENNFKHLNFDIEKNIVMRLITSSDDSRVPLTGSSPQSVAHALFSAGSMGISLSPALDHAMLIGEIASTGAIICKLHLTYRGLLHLCYEAGAITHVTLWVIRKEDKLSMSNDITCKPKLEIANLFGDRGDVVGALCTICTPQKDYLTTLMTAQELDQIACISGNPAWHGVFGDEFRKKQVLKRALHTVASAYHGRVANAAKYLSEQDLDLYERTERKAISASRPQQKVSTPTHKATRGEAAFKRPVPNEGAHQEARDVPKRQNVSTTGLYNF